MQLNNTSIAAALGLLAANLVGAMPAAAQEAPVSEAASPGSTQPETGNAYDRPVSETGALVADGSLLFYQEDNGRVRAIEPVMGLTYYADDGTIYSGKFTYDTLTGASANGATRAAVQQRFIAPINETGTAGTSSEEPDASTGASGTYYAEPGKLPVDTGFKDHREAIDLGMTTPIASTLKLSGGVSGSWETDYTSYSVRAALIKDFDRKNTTVSLGVNVERDTSRPYYGVPEDTAGMGASTIGTQRTKRVQSVIASVTQVMTPNWLISLNYTYGHSTGYHTDPYKLVSLIDGDTGDPFWYIYEKRPETRNKHSVFLASKVAFGSAVTTASVRYYSDSWGIKSWTFALSERLPVGRSFFIQPEVRYYHQTQADFFKHYLLLADPTPAYVSADSRLDRFSAVTFGLTAGAKVTDGLEFYAKAERYQQSGSFRDSNAPGALASYDLFGGVKAISVMTGFKATFR